MLQKGIPIDLVTGVSFGSLAAAYYCARGAAGLEHLRASGGRVLAACLMSTVSSSAISDMVDEDLGGVRLADLPTPFFPVATDIDRVLVHPVWEGTVGEGVRASGAFPGVFSPLNLAARRFVDGCVTENVPVSTLIEEQAAMIVASNALPNVACDGPADERPLGWSRRLLRLGPIARINDLIRSARTAGAGAGATFAAYADVFVAPNQPDYEAWDFRQADDIIERARGSVAETVAEIARTWAVVRDNQAVVKRPRPKAR